MGNTYKYLYAKMPGRSKHAHAQSQFWELETHLESLILVAAVFLITLPPVGSGMGTERELFMYVTRFGKIRLMPARSK